MATDAPDAQDDDRRKRVAAVAAAIIILLLLCWILSRFVPVPSVLGMSEQRATDTIEEAGFVVGEISYVDGDEDEAGTVTDQSPDPGTRHFRGGRVNLVIAGAGAGSDDDGSPGDDAFKEDSGLPAPSYSDEGDRIDDTPYSVDRRPRMISVLGMSEASARDTLQRAGLAYTIDYGPSTASYEGTVFFQNPPPGAFYDRGVSVDVWVSTGPPQPNQPYPKPGP